MFRLHNEASAWISRIILMALPYSVAGFTYCYYRDGVRLQCDSCCDHGCCNIDTTAKLIAGAATGGGALLMFILAVCISQWKQKLAAKPNEKTGHASDVELHTAANGNHIALESLINIHSGNLSSVNIVTAGAVNQNEIIKSTNTPEIECHDF